MKITNLILAYTNTLGRDLDSTVAMSSIYASTISLFAMAIILVVLFVLTRRKHKWPIFGFFAGISVYLVFHFFAASTFSQMLFLIPGLNELSNNTVAVVTSYAIMGAILMLFGRWISYKAFAFRCNKFSEGLAFGVGIMATEAVFSIINFFLYTVTSLTINSIGISEWVKGATSQSSYDSLLDGVFYLVDNSAVFYVAMAITTVLYMIYHIIITVPIFGAFQKKISKKWYGFALGTFFFIQLFKALRAAEVITITVEMILTAMVVVFTFYYCKKLYIELYKSEEFDPDKDVKKPETKIPKFNNLSKL